MKRPKMIYIGNVNSRMPTEGPFVDALRELGDLTIIRDGSKMPDKERADLIRQHNILLTMWGSMPVPDEIAEDRGNLEYICNITGEMKHWISLKIIESGIPVTNWGDAPANSIAEGAMALLLAVLKDLHGHIQNVRNGNWEPGENSPGGTLENLRLGIYGLGVIGVRFVELVKPFGPYIKVYDPYVNELPEGCLRAESLEELFDWAQAVVIHAGLTDETRKSVTADLLARLPDNGIIINTARGDIIDQDALFAELEKGRLRAGLDVLAGPDRVPPDHPARKWENCILTTHSIGRNQWFKPPGGLSKMELICLDNIRRFINGQPLRFIMDRERYLRST